MTSPVDLDALRRYAVGRSLFGPLDLAAAIERLGFVQADPIRAPARAQDLTLRHRVLDYRADDLERRYPMLDIEEDLFINYGFLPRSIHALMHPRATNRRLAKMTKREQALVDFVRERGDAHPRDVDRHFSHGTVTNYWGGSSSATTHMLDALHYRGVLRVVRRADGIRVYGVREQRASDSAVDTGERLDALIDVIVGKYAPLPAQSLSGTVGRLRYGVPQWRRHVAAALARARRRLRHAHIAGHEWYWPAGEDAQRHGVDERVRLLAPFDPIVWDRRRFELLWQWRYRFEAYTPAAKREFGYYALPMLWRDRIVGWSNVSVRNGRFDARFGYVKPSTRRDALFARERDEEIDRLKEFLRARG
jgi:uncharacterized protein YcaQ